MFRKIQKKTDKLKIQTIHKLNTTQKSKQRKIQQNKTTLKAGSVVFYDTRSVNEEGLFYNASEPIRCPNVWC